jgi:hypothetical protein
MTDEPKLKVIHPEGATAKWNPFDPESLRSVVQGESFETKKVLLKIAIRKPKKDEFFRVHPDPEMKIPTKLYYTGDREVFVVNPSLEDITRTVLVVIHLCVARDGTPFFWPIREPEAGKSGAKKDNDYWSSSREAVSYAENEWVRIEANQHAGNYSLTLARGKLPPPQWPDLSLREMLELAIKGRTIEDENHDIIRSLLGEI